MKTSKTCAVKRRAVTDQGGQAEEHDGWEDAEVSRKAKPMARRASSPAATPRSIAADTRACDTPAAEKTAYFGPGASSTDLRLRAPARRESLALHALDLARAPGLAPMVVPPVALPWLEKKFPTVESLVVRAASLNDGRLVDAKGNSYLPGPFNVKTEFSSGGMLVCFEGVQPQAYWAKKIDVPAGEPLPQELHCEVALNFKTQDAARPHRILRTDDAFILLMPYMMGDSFALYRLLEGAEPSALASHLDAGANKTLPLQLKKLFASKMLQSVANANQQNIFHRDIKLTNFAYHLDSISLIDFGSAHQGGASPRYVASSPDHLAPDHLYVDGAKDPAMADAYALGASLYWLFTGDNFFGPHTAAIGKAQRLDYDRKAALDQALAGALAHADHPVVQRWADWQQQEQDVLAHMSVLIASASRAAKAGDKKISARINQLLAGSFVHQESIDAAQQMRPVLATSATPALLASFDGYAASLVAARDGQRSVAAAAREAAQQGDALGEATAAWLEANGAHLAAHGALQAAKTAYARVWPLMQAAAFKLRSQADALAQVAALDVPAKVDAIVGMEALRHAFAPAEQSWADSFAALLRQDPAGAYAIVMLLAPTDRQRMTASAASALYGAANKATSDEQDLELLGVLGKMNAVNIRNSHALAERMAQEAKERLAAPAPHYDELQLENQPNVSSLEEAKAYILRLASEEAPKIPVLTDTAGNIKRIRELYVKLT